MLQALVHRPFTPRQIFNANFAAALDFFREQQHALGCVLTTVQHHVFAVLAQLRFQFVVNADLTRVDDAHGEPGLDRVIQKHRVQRLAHMVVAAKRKRHVRDAAGGLGTG